MKIPKIVNEKFAMSIIDVVENERVTSAETINEQMTPQEEVRRALELLASKKRELTELLEGFERNTFLWVEYGFLHGSTSTYMMNFFPAINRMSRFGLGSNSSTRKMLPDSSEEAFRSSYLST
jgi:hypothetical protein